MWVVFLNENGECWTFPNGDVRMVNNFTLGRYVNLANFASYGGGDIHRQPSPVLVNRETSPESGTPTPPGS